MCGLVGSFSHQISADIEAITQKMALQIEKRGPDAFGVWSDRNSGIALGHRRLAILDLSAAGHQPMVDSSGRYVLVFNGEIYNHLELRRDLPAQNWRGHSDTETLLAGFNTWGLELTLKRCHGMFAIALWDKETKTLTLARDRMGEKPLYYGVQGKHLLFGSELSALRAHPAFEGKINTAAITLLLQLKYIPAPHSIYQGIHKLLPGHTLTFRDPLLAGESRCYWDNREVLTAAQNRPFQGSLQEASDELDRMLRKSVERQMIADVPLGAFLSGGIDSSTVVGVMQSLSPRPIKTFTIGFQEKDFNEAEHAKAVAKHLGTDHEELYVTPQHALDLVPRLPTIYSEPFADKSQIPTTLLCAMTRRHVTVALSGDGGDELFAGYTRYQETLKWHNKTQQIPNSLKGVVRAGVRTASLVDKKHREFAALLGISDPSLFYRHRVSKWHDAADVLQNPDSIDTVFEQENRQPRPKDFVHRMMGIDLNSYLPDYILCKVDRAAMAASLETRIPLLDHSIVEFAWTLPTTMLIRDGKGKQPLRHVLDKYVPRPLIDRPKTGFNVPVGAWLRGPLKEWAENHLSENRLRDEGFFNVERIRKQWHDHLKGHNRTESLWSVLMFQAWFESQKRSLL